MPRTGHAVIGTSMLCLISDSCASPRTLSSTVRSPWPARVVGSDGSEGTGQHMQQVKEAKTDVFAFVAPVCLSTLFF